MKKLLLIFTITCNLIAYCQEGRVFESFARDELDNGNFVGAIDFLNKAIEKESSPINLRALYSYRAYVKLKQKDYTSAIADFTKAESYSSLGNGELVERAKAKNELKDYRGAIKDYDYYLKKNGFNVEIAALGSSFFNLSKEEQEKEKENIKQRYSNVYLLRGNAKLNLGDLIGAKDDYDIIIKYINPEYASAYFNRGLVKIDLKQKDNACLDFSRAGELGLTEAYVAIKKYCN